MSFRRLPVHLAVAALLAVAGMLGGVLRFSGRVQPDTAYAAMLDSTTAARLAERESPPSVGAGAAAAAITPAQIAVVVGDLLLTPIDYFSYLPAAIK